MATIDIAITCDRWRAELPAVEDLARRAARAALARARPLPAGLEIGIRLADDATVRELNARYRGRDRATNVLSFANEPLDAAPVRFRPGPPLMLGDVVLAHGVVRREADRAGIELAAHLNHLIVHGVLHLLGYDHEDAEEAAIMEPLEVEILHGLGIRDPYAGAAGEPAAKG